MKKFILILLWSVLSFGQASNEMVTFTAAQSLGFALNPGQSHVTSNQCITKSEALAKYNLSTSAMDGYANNQLVPRSTWVSGVVSYAFGVNARGNLDGNGWFTTNEDAGCENNNIIATFYSASSTLGIGVTVYKDSNLTDLCFSTGNAHYLYASAGDFLFTLGNGSVITSITSCTDNISPTQPTDLTASIDGSNNVTLTWTASTDNVGVTGYKIYRTGGLILTIENVTTININNECGGTHTYTIEAFDAADNMSALSAQSNSVYSTNPGECF